MVPKLSDLGLYLLGPLSTSRPKVFAGTCGYMASEYNIEGSLIDKYDVYSFGMVLLEMICTIADQMIIGYLNLPSHCPANVALLIFSKQFPVEEIIDPGLKGKIAPECWEPYRDITQRCLRYEADERLTMGEVEVLLEEALSRQEEADITKRQEGDIIPYHPPPILISWVQTLNGEETHSSYIFDDSVYMTVFLGRNTCVHQGYMSPTWKKLMKAKDYMYMD